MTTTTITYDDCRSAADVGARYKELFVAHIGTDWPVTRHPRYWEISEGARRAYERFPVDAGTRAARSAGDGPSRPRSGRETHEVRPEEHDDGTLTITCTGPCGETKPVKRFPTTRAGGRLDVCRACRDAAYAKARAERGV